MYREHTTLQELGIGMKLQGMVKVTSFIIPKMYPGAWTWLPRWLPLKITILIALILYNCPEQLKGQWVLLMASILPLQPFYPPINDFLSKRHKCHKDYNASNATFFIMWISKWSKRITFEKPKEKRMMLFLNERKNPQCVFLI